MDEQSPTTDIWSSKEDTSLYDDNHTISKIFFITGLAFLLLFLHYTHPLTPLALFLLLLMILLCKVLLDFLVTCFLSCPCLWTLVIVTGNPWVTQPLPAPTPAPTPA